MFIMTNHDKIHLLYTSAARFCPEIWSNIGSSVDSVHSGKEFVWIFGTSRQQSVIPRDAATC